jgi:hypothetical protein
LLMPFDPYVEKRISDMTQGFSPEFDMNAWHL